MRSEPFRVCRLRSVKGIIASETLYPEDLGIPGWDRADHELIIGSEKGSTVVVL